MSNDLSVGIGLILVVIGWAVSMHFILKHIEYFDSACTGDCNQGRDCTCKEIDNDIQPN